MNRSAAEDDNFDPMSEAYHSHSFNSYIKGPGSNIKSSMHTNTRRKEDGGYIKLHIANISPSLKESGLQNLFSEFGKLNSVYIHQTMRESSNSKWGFIEFSSFSEAQAAITALHNRPPHNLSVKFAMSDKEKEAKKKLKESGYLTSTENDPEPLMPSGSHGRGRPAGLKGPNPRNMKSSYQPPRSYYDEDLQSSRSYSPGIFNPTDEHRSLVDVANKTIMCTINADGPRKVSRASCSSIFYHDANNVQIDLLSKEIKERYLQIDDSVAYKFGEDETSRLYPPSVCSHCGSAARKICFVCKIPYCSKNCLVKDWPKHQNYCSKDSPNENDRGAMQEKVQVNGRSNGYGPHEEQSSFNKRGFGNRNAYIAKRPHIKERGEPQNSMGTISRTIKNDMYQTNGQLPTQPTAKPLMSGVDIPATKKPTTPISINKSSIATPVPLKVNEECRVNDTEDIANDAGIGFSPSSGPQQPLKEGSTLSPKWNFLPSGQFTEIIVTLLIKRNEFWATKANLELQAEILNKLNEHCNGPDAVVISEPLRLNKCAVFYDGDWYRGRIIDVLPNIVVQLADYGNVEVVEQSNLRFIPTDLAKIPPQAVCIRLAEGTPQEYSNLKVDDPLKVKPVCKIGDSWVVHVEGVTYPEPPPESVPVKSPPPSTVVKQTVNLAPLMPFLPKTTAPVESPKPLISQEAVKPVPAKPLMSPEPLKPVSESKPDLSTSTSSLNSSTPVPKKSAFLSKLKKPASLIPENPALPFEKYSKITLVVAVSSSEYWATRTDELPNLLIMTTKLDSCASQSVTPKLGEIYVKVYSDVWCRARVISLNPLKVFYIDYGNEEIVDASELRPVPVEFYGVSSYAFKIKLADGTSRKYYNIDPENTDCSENLVVDLWVKPACQLPDKTLVVLVQGEDYSNVATKASCQMKHVVDGAGNKVELIVNKVFNDDFIACSLVIPGDSSLEKLTEEIAKVKLNPVTKNETAGNPVVCEGQDGTRGRGYIMTSSESEVRVALTDLARVVIAASLAPTPAEISQKPDAGVRLTLETPAREFQKGEKLIANVNQRKGDELIVKVENAGEGGISVAGVVGIWSPRVEEAGLPAISIAPKSQVIISAFQSPHSVYLQSDDRKGKELLATILQDTAAHTMNCPTLDRKPYTGEVLACRFAEDDNYYRAQILKKKMDKYTVIFLDFGNTAEVVQADLKPLDNSLKMVPCSAVKVGLKGVDKDTLNVETASFLNELVSLTTVLFVDYDDGDLSQVKLTTRDGLDLNNKVMSLLDPNWKAQLEAGEDPTGGNVFVSSDIKYTVWESGANIDIAIVDKMGSAMLGVNGTDGTLDYMCENFTQQVSEYCESFAPNYSYNPRFNEVCLVKFERDSLWYRALCTQCNKTTSNVLFIDFGNKGEVSHKDIRPITPEFASALSILKRIHIYGVPENLPEALAKRVNDLFPEDREEPYPATVVDDRQDGNVVVYFPHVAEVAAQIGLSPIVCPQV